MLKNGLLFLICGIGTTVAILLWKKSVLDRERNWFLSVIAVCLCMTFGVSPFFDTDCVGMMLVFLLILLSFWMAKLLFVEELKESNDYKKTADRINEMKNRFLMIYWFVFSYSFFLTLI